MTRVVSELQLETRFSLFRLVLIRTLFVLFVEAELILGIRGALADQHLKDGAGVRILVYRNEPRSCNRVRQRSLKEICERYRVDGLEQLLYFLLVVFRNFVLLNLFVYTFHSLLYNSVNSLFNVLLYVCIGTLLENF